MKVGSMLNIFTGMERINNFLTIQIRFEGQTAKIKLYEHKIPKVSDYLRDLNKMAVCG